MAPDAHEQPLTHDEVWDDRALIDSWNEALAEYKKYHSIYVKGGNVEDLVAPKVQETNDAPTKVDPNGGDTYQDEAKTETPQSPPAAAEQADEPMAKPIQSAAVPLANAPPSQGASLIPAPMLAPVRDENLKQLLMSWYYTGYYTGLHEGQQQSQQVPGSS